jgi:hypothetical protein
VELQSVISRNMLATTERGDIHVGRPLVPCVGHTTNRRRSTQLAHSSLLVCAQCKFPILPILSLYFFKFSFNVLVNLSIIPSLFPAVK